MLCLKLTHIWQGIKNTVCTVRREILNRCTTLMAQTSEKFHNKQQLRELIQWLQSKNFHGKMI